MGRILWVVSYGRILWSYLSANIKSRLHSQGMSTMLPHMLPHPTMLPHMLPDDVLRYIMEFLRRPDWRICKREEANLILGEVNARTIQAYYLGFWMKDLEEIYTWTLFGLRYIVRCQYTVSMYETKDYGLCYSDWYEHRLQLI